MNCNEILQHGIYDYKSIDFAHSKSIWYVQHFIKSDYQSFDEAKSGEANADIPLESVMLGLGFKYDEREFKEFKSHIEKYISFTQQEQLKLDVTLKEINDNVINAWKDCISLDGPHIWVVHTHNVRKFIIGTRFNGDNPNPKMTDVSWGSKVKVSNGPYFSEDGQVKPDNIIKHSIKYQEVERLTDDPINIIINLDKASAFYFSLPAIPEQAKEPSRLFDHKQSKRVSNVTNAEVSFTNDTSTDRYARGKVRYFIYSYLGNGGRLDVRCYLNNVSNLVDRIDKIAVAVTAGPELNIPEFKLAKNEKAKIIAKMENFDGIDTQHSWIEIFWEY